MRNYFPKRPLGAPLHTLSKLYEVPVGFVTPPPFFEVVYCFICGRRRVVVALKKRLPTIARVATKLESCECDKLIKIINKN